MPLLLARRRALLLAAAAVLGIGAAAPPPSPLSSDDLILVEQARDYLRGLSNAMGRFAQTDPRGRTTNGAIYLRRPGRARFEYDPPSGLVVAANGFRVAVMDRRLKTIDAYPLGATPLGILLSSDIRIDKQVAIGGVKRTAAGFSIVASRAGKRNQGQIALEFSFKPLRLMGWTITDPQGGVTRVDLLDFGPSKSMPNAFFELSPDQPAPAKPTTTD
jgi:outer membrane lipoprotein-sorting protein